MNASLNELLKQTSRSFYRTLRILPIAVRGQISLAYLLARTTDTIADTELVSLERRLASLQKLRERIRGTNDARLDFGELVGHQSSPAESALLEKVEASLTLLRTLSPADLQLIRTVLDIIASGQELDLRRFAGASADDIMALSTDAELDDYTYRVAGCVGEFWTKMCRTHLFPGARLDDTRSLADGVRFGKGLQLVNILRDMPVDLHKGRCYLPADGLAAIGLSPVDLLQPANESRLRPLYNALLDRAEAHLAAGWAYTNALPRGQVRVRLACAWPILIGVETIKRLRIENVLDPAHHIKITRAQVRKLFARSVVFYAWPAAWNRLFSPAASAQGKAVASGANLK
jgi:farnesyl-diphosphate farnesyltransferase